MKAAVTSCSLPSLITVAGGPCCDLEEKVDGGIFQAFYYVGSAFGDMFFVHPRRPLPKHLLSWRDLSCCFRRNRKGLVHCRIQFNSNNELKIWTEKCAYLTFKRMEI
ncbi:hypothetical protein NPIL_368481 [Nephila pilipes]|uniref:Uncharacterized protein n=1 Tax=Nephila pilipes TaxID=299642 RepID=A0A8X6MVB1_NEPPI|nr:hypothetical protein NPIL_368481 [Nephila pilipes]